MRASGAACGVARPTESLRASFTQTVLPGIRSYTTGSPSIGADAANSNELRMRITRVRSYPLTVPIGDLQRTSQGSFGTISILVVVVETDAGVSGVGEALARYGPKAYAELVDGLLAPKIIGMDPFAADAVWQRLFRSFSGRSGGMLIEAIAAIDTALWDIMGKATGQPVHRLLGGMGRARVQAYASSIPWQDDAEATSWTERCLAWGFKEIKVKIGAPVPAAIARARLVREVAGPDDPAHGGRQLDLRRRRGARGGAGAGRARLLLVRGADRAGGPRGLSLAARAGAAPARRRRERAYRAGCRAPAHRTRGGRDPARCRALGRDQRDAADRRPRPGAARALCAARRGERCGLRRGEPAARGRDAELPHLRVHDLSRTRCATG